MWSYWILLLCATGVTSAIVDSRNYSKDPGIRIRRFACPVGFFRLNRFCYYLSGGKASWQEANFKCKDRNATLAILDRSGKDKFLRNYLMSDEFKKHERWIGGIYNWERKTWIWGVNGEELVYQNFAKTRNVTNQNFEWHCIVMDPTARNKWSPKPCYSSKHYVCEVPAGRIGGGGRRRKVIDPNAPQNQRLRPGPKDERRNRRKEGGSKSRGKDKLQRTRKHKWIETGNSRIWNNGVHLGYRPPANGTRRNRARRIKSQHSRKQQGRIRISKNSNSTVPMRNSSEPWPIAAGKHDEYTAFVADGPNNPLQIQQLADVNSVLSHYQEEILLKP